ncbi:MAG: hypothetical protein LBQ34_02980 [Alphaproteobacteria bacterium]|jgi:hypothetical protein|nr:hypothetical protein [Alphaproteobacteria bacterium]
MSSDIALKEVSSFTDLTPGSNKKVAKSLKRIKSLDSKPLNVEVELERLYSKIEQNNLETSSKVKTIELEQNNKIDKLSHKIDKVEINLKAEINHVETRLNGRMDSLEEKFHHLDSRTSIKFNLVVGMFFVIVAGIIAILIK